MYKRVAAALLLISCLCWLFWPKSTSNFETAQIVPEVSSSVVKAESHHRNVNPVRRTHLPKQISPERRSELLSAFLRARLAGPIKLDPDEIRPVASTKLSSREYVREQIEGVRPLIFECYKKAKEIDPDLKPQLPVSFTIGGEPGIGGIVTETAVHPELEKQQGLINCVKETLLSLEIDPPELDENGGVGEVNVRYTFKFEDEDKGV